MRLVLKNEFNTEDIYEKGERYPTRCYVILNGQKTGTIIKGIVLEKCVCVYDYYLVFMTMDCPFEESLHISLLDKSGKILEEKDIFVAYYTDDFSDLKLYPPNIVTFDFLYKGLWRIEILSTPRKLNIIKSLTSIIGKDYKLGIYWNVNLDLDQQKSIFSFKLKKLVLILLCCCGLLYLFGYF